MHLHLNPLGGLAGDMFCAALLDARPDLLPVARAALAAVSMPRPVRVDLLPAEGPLSGRRFRVRPEGPAPDQRHHTPYREISASLQEAPLESGVRERALSVFDLLADAEARVHGTEPEAVLFHEVGAWDSIADIVSAAALLVALGVNSASCAPLPVGGGRVRSAHGMLPVPAPATAILLEGLSVHSDGVEGERVTPTGAAILKSLVPRPEFPDGTRLVTSGMGFGTRRLPGLPNCLQILCLEPSSACGGFDTDRVEQLRFEVDDQTPEDLALGLDRLRETDGVLSVTTQQAIGKKGRPTMAVEVLTRRDRLEAVVEVCFRETTTIGLRHQRIERFVLRRDQRMTAVVGCNLDVKVVHRPQGETAKAESDDLAGVTGCREREELRREASAAALAQSGKTGLGVENG